MTHGTDPPTTPREHASCERFQELLALDVGGDTTPREQAQLQEHLDHCVACLRLSEELATSQEALLRSAPTRPDDEALAELHTALARRLPEASASVVGGPWTNRRPARRAASPRVWLALAAALLVALASARLLLREPQGPSTSETHTVERLDIPLGRADGTTGPVQDPGHARADSVQVAEAPPPAETEPPLEAPAPPTSTPAPGMPPPAVTPPAVTPPAVTPPRVALAQANDRDSPTLLKLVSDDPDLVIYWLVDPPTATEEPTDATTI